MAGKDLATAGLATIFGGSGFLGRYVVRALAGRGWRIRAGSRRPDLANYLQPMGRVGQIQAVQTNLRYASSLAPALRDADIAVNLVGVLTEGGRQNFEAVHVFGARAAARAARDAGVRRFVQVSAIGADPEAESPLCQQQGPGRSGRARGLPRCRDPAAFRAVRPRGRFLQPFRGPGPHGPGAAADRRRRDALPACLCRGRGRGGRPRGGGKCEAGRDLRTRRTRGEDLPGDPRSISAASRVGTGRCCRYRSASPDIRRPRPKR